ncbi:MAG: hypothetical protein ABJA78_08085 [Ferruginibacter sp.]
MSTEIRYHQENLLDKFIKNEKRSKLWALLSVLAFFAVGSAILVIAYKIKKEQVVRTIVAPSHTDTIYITKTMGEQVNKNPDKDNQINQQQVEITRLQEQLNTAETKYTQQTQYVQQLVTQLEACNSKPTTSIVTPTTTPTASTIIYVYTLGGTADSTISKIRNTLSGKRGSGVKLIFGSNRAEARPAVNYVDPKYQKVADDIANYLNNKDRFRMQGNLPVVQVKGTVSEGANVEIFLRYIN